MPTTTSAEQALINGTEFLDGLAQFSDERQASAVRPLEQPRRTDLAAFDALDSGLPIDAYAPDIEATPREHTRVEAFDALPASRQAPDERRIPLMTAALVLLACLTAGAITAAYLFQDRLTPVTARPSAIR